MLLSHQLITPAVLIHPPNHTAIHTVQEGMPISKMPGRRGDLVVKFEVQFPRSLTEAQKQQLRATLPS